jgi:hypothetical protein
VQNFSMGTTNHVVAPIHMNIGCQAK